METSLRNGLLLPHLPIAALLKIVLDLPELICRGCRARRTGFGKCANSGGVLSREIQLEMRLRASADSPTNCIPAPFFDSESQTISAEISTLGIELEPAPGK